VAVADRIELFYSGDVSLRPATVEQT